MKTETSIPLSFTPVSRLLLAAMVVAGALSCFGDDVLADTATNYPQSKVSGLLPKRQSANSAAATIRDRVPNRAMLQTTTNAAINTKRAAQADVTFETVARGMHSTVHQVVRRSTNTANGASTSEASRIVELADGLNFRDEDGNWRQTQAAFEETPQAFVAKSGPHKAILSRQMSEAALDLQTPDGVRLVGAPLCLGYFDPVSGKSVILAVAHPSTADQINSN